MVSLRRRHSGKRVEILLRCCACDQVRFDLAVLKPEALERSPDDIILDSEEAPDGNTEISGQRFKSLEGGVSVTGSKRGKGAAGNPAFGGKIIEGAITGGKLAKPNRQNHLKPTLASRRFSSQCRPRLTRV
jgi:hypothetical protein